MVAADPRKLTCQESGCTAKPAEPTTRKTPQRTRAVCPKRERERGTPEKRWVSTGQMSSGPQGHEAEPRVPEREAGDQEGILRVYQHWYTPERLRAKVSPTENIAGGRRSR